MIVIGRFWISFQNKMVDQNFVSGYTRAKLETLREILKKLEGKQVELDAAQINSLRDKAAACDVNIRAQLYKVKLNAELDELLRIHAGIMNSIETKAKLRLDILSQNSVMQTIGIPANKRGAIPKIKKPNDSDSKKQNKGNVQNKDNELNRNNGEDKANEQNELAVVRDHNSSSLRQSAMEEMDAIALPKLSIERSGVWNRLGNATNQHANGVQNRGHRLVVEPIRPRSRPRQPLPPFADSCPVRLVITDRLVGLTELYVQRPRTNDRLRCPECDRAHPLYACPRMLRASLPERWFIALTVGVCLNCLRYGHSSGRCRNGGDCVPCRRPHNSVLCPAEKED